MYTTEGRGQENQVEKNEERESEKDEEQEDKYEEKQKAKDEEENEEEEEEKKKTRSYWSSGFRGKILSIKCKVSVIRIFLLLSCYFYLHISTKNCVSSYLFQL